MESELVLPPDDLRQPEAAGYLADAFGILLRAVERDTWQRDGLADTPVRAAKAWRERMDGYGRDPAELFRTFDAESYDEMVALGPIPFDSTCEHHCERFTGEARIAYIAHPRIIGLSKLARLVDLFAHRLQVQERLTAQIADSIEEHLAPTGIAVMLAARHGCIECRGVKKPGVRAITNVLRGKLREDAAARAEALALLRAL